MKTVRIRILIACLFSYLSIPLMIFILFSLFLSFTKHHKNLLNSTYDFIFVSKSSRFALIFAFHFVVTTIFLGSSKPSVEDLEWDFSYHHPPMYAPDNTKEQGSCYHSDNDEEEVEVEDDDDDIHVGCHLKDIVDYEGDDDHVDDDHDMDIDDFDNESDDAYFDLERRAEEFIAKVNQKCREELLSDRLLLLTSD